MTDKEPEECYCPPGEKKSTFTNMLELTANAIQSFDPLKGVHEHICGFHFYSHDMTRQVEAHHFCSHQNEDVRQCLIYDSDKQDAKLIGVEYIISDKVYLTLPEEEKKYWHSHVYEVKSGMLTLPFNYMVPNALADATEKKVMEGLVNTYGKTWHFWQVDRGDPLPYGPPQLMMSFVKDNQISPKLLEDRDSRYKVSTEELRQKRADIKSTYNVDSNADHWIHRDDGMAYQCEMIATAQKKVEM
ncbi:675_t:CDS:2 [Acaulospora morrowiae]|uniref:675_t:CDS:1 n=1 Tax=Acaulospora morrowiae TaxID=94023 RepID=A0A9N8VL79_9GLOM|nr:675_t:CDS:2 [Acaulospora morrowiae]